MAEYTITFKDFVTEEGENAVECLLESDVDQELTDAGLFTAAVARMFREGDLAWAVKEMMEEDTNNDGRD